MRMRARAPKVPPMMDLTGTFDLPCPPVDALAEAPNVEPEEEDCCVTDEEYEDDNEEEDEGVPCTIARESR
jgi:hypothetical protein